MKMKKRTVVSAVLSVLLILTAAIAFATTAPGVNGEVFAQYETFGLRYAAAGAQLYFGDQPVRYFEDTGSADDGQEGIVYFCATGEVDVRAVREGDVLGLVIDALTGETMQVISAPADGLIFSQRGYSAVYPGTLIARLYRKERA